MKVRYKFCKCLVSALFFAVVPNLALQGRIDAYVLPSEQLLQFMAPRFSEFETLVVSHTVERKDEEGIQLFEEILTMKGPGFLHAAPAEGAGNQARVIDRSFRNLFLASSQAELRALLSGAGVGLDRVSYKRVDGTVAYLIGERSAYSPKLAVEKERFLPLLFCYSSRLAHGSEFIRVTFRDYRQVESGWYPFEILCSSDAGWEERYRVRSVEVNVPVDPSLFQSSQEEPRPAETPHSDERIDAIIRDLEQKYGR